MGFMLYAVSIAPTPVDPRRGRFNQGMITSLLLIAFVVNWPLLLPAVMTVLLAGSILGPRFDALLTLYLKVVAPHLELRPDLEDPRPMRFAAGLEGGALAAATAGFMTGYLNAAWGVTLGVAVVAGLSATTDFCLGCAVYRLVTGSRNEGGTGGTAAPARSMPVAPAPSVALRWHAWWAGFRQLGRGVTVVGQNADGDTVVRAGPEWFLLRREDQRFWPVTTCLTCQRDLAESNGSRRHRLVQCEACSSQPQGC